MNDLSPSETLELAEFLSCYSKDEQGAALSLDDALRVVESTDAYALQLSPNDYLVYLKLIQSIQENGPLMPVSKLPDAISKFILDMFNHGYTLMEQQVLLRSVHRVQLIWFILGASLTFGLCFFIFR